MCFHKVGIDFVQSWTDFVQKCSSRAREFLLMTVRRPSLKEAKFGMGLFTLNRRRIGRLSCTLTEVWHRTAHLAKIIFAVPRRCFFLKAQSLLFGIRGPRRCCTSVARISSLGSLDAVLQVNQSSWQCGFCSTGLPRRFTRWGC